MFTLFRRSIRPSDPRHRSPSRRMHLLPENHLHHLPSIDLWYVITRLICHSYILYLDSVRSPHPWRENVIRLSSRSNFNFHLNTSHHFASVKSLFIRIHQKCIPTHLRNHRIVINPSQRKKKKLDNPSKATIHHADQRTTNSSIQNRSIRSFRSPSDALANLPVFRWNGRGAVVLLLSAITRCPQTDREREREISQAVGH